MMCSCADATMHEGRFPNLVDRVLRGVTARLTAGGSTPRSLPGR